MTWPTGVTLRTCTLGPDFGIVSGSDYGCDIVVSVSRPSMTWGATGSGGVGDTETLTFTPGQEVSFQLPVTDQVGWYIGGLPVDLSNGRQSHVYTLTIKPWIYNSLGRKTFSSTTLTLSNLAIPTGTDPLDLDMSVATSGAQGGTVTIPDLVAELQASVEASADSAAASATDAAASAQQAHDISNIDTSDDVVSTLVADPQTGPKTTAALNAAIGGFEVAPSGAPSLLRVTSNVINAEPITPLDFLPSSEHAAALAKTSTYDATSVFSDIVASTTRLYFEGRGCRLNHGNIDLGHLSNGFTYDGQGAVHCLVGTAPTTGPNANSIGLQLSGEMVDLDMHGFTIIGDGVVADGHKGVYSNSDAALSLVRPRLHQITARSTIVGFSINAYLGGAFDHPMMDMLYAQDIAGIASGSGYGFHFAIQAAAGIAATIGTLIADGCNRHDVYIASDSDISIGRIVSRNHRANLTTAERTDATDGRGKTRAVVNIARSNSVVIGSIEASNGYDGVVSIVPSPEGLGVAEYDVNISSVNVRNPHNPVPPIVIGDPSPSVAGIPEHVTIGRARFFADYTNLTDDAGNPLTPSEMIQVNAGHNVTLRNVDATMLGLRSSVAAIQVFGRDGTSGSPGYLDDLLIDGVSAHMEVASGVTGLTPRAVWLDSAVCAATSGVTIKSVEPRGDATADVVYGGVLSNPNIRAYGRSGACLGIYAAGDTTPSVARGLTHLVIANAAPTSIITLDDGARAQTVTLRFADINTTLVNATSGPGFRLNGSTNLASGTRDTVTLYTEGDGIWYEVAPKSDN